MSKNHSHIKELFIKLKMGHDYLNRHKEDNSRCAELVDRSEPIFKELEPLGVSRDFSIALLIFGAQFIDSLPKLDGTTPN